MNRNTIYLRRKRKLILEQESVIKTQPSFEEIRELFGVSLYTHKEVREFNARLIATMLKNVEQLGFTFSSTLIEKLKSLPIKESEGFYKQLVTDLKGLIGADVDFKPMYPNFPKQVMEMEESELYMNALMHYEGDLLGQRILPEYKKEERFPLLDGIKLKIIELGSREEFEKIVINLIGSKSSISQTDKEDIEWFVKEYHHKINVILPDDIPMKENVAFLSSLLLKHTKVAEKVINRYIKTATDVLRLAVGLSDGDVSLAKNTKFRNFKRQERHLLLKLLEKSGNITEDMLRYKNVWIRLGEKLHPFEFQEFYPKSFEAFDIIRNDKPFETFNGKVEKAISTKEIKTAVELLKSRPGEFARRLDNLLRLEENNEYIIEGFAQIAENVASPVLLQVMTHFKYRNQNDEQFMLQDNVFDLMRKNEIAVEEPLDLRNFIRGFSKKKETKDVKETPFQGLRVFFPKGNVAKATAIENNLPKLSDEVCLKVQSICKEILVEKFAKLPSIGNVYLDNNLTNFLVPFSQRSASKALRTIVRGSKLRISEGNTIRFFIWWKEGQINGVETERVDIDLSSVLYDGNWRYLEHISYTNLKSDKYNAAHSGDITSAPDGACEFIDLDIPSILNYGGRYVVMCIHSFTHHPFCNLPECFGGWMIRQFPNSGEIFEPQTLQDKVDVVADTQICIPVILDLKERDVIWCDLALKANPNFSNNIEGNQQSLILMAKALTTLKKTTLYDLFDLHIAARGKKVNNKSEADTIFSIHEGITPFDIEKIMAEYM
jgi:hypothetical protein